MDNISSLDGYDELLQKVINEISKRASDSPSLMFEVDHTLELDDMFKDGQARKGQYNGRDQLDLLLGGRAFAVLDAIDEYDHLSDLDNAWFEKERDEVIESLSGEIDAFADANDIEQDDVYQSLKDHDRMTVWEVVDSPLHFYETKYRGSVPVLVDTDCEVCLVPTSGMARGLSAMKITPADWIAAVSQEAKEYPEETSQFMRNCNHVFDVDQFSRDLCAEVSKLSALGYAFASDSTQQLVSSTELLHKMCHVWSVSDAQLVLRFNLDADHINNVSLPISRSSEAHEIAENTIEIQGGCEITPSGDDLGKGEGLRVDRVMSFKLGAIRLADKYSDDREVPSTKIAGTNGLLLSTYEILLSDKSSSDLIMFAKKKPEKEALTGTVCISGEIALSLTKLYASSDPFDAERIAAKYPGLVQYLPKFEHKDSKQLGFELLNLVEGAMFESQRKWGASEQRERAAWLVRQGADLSIRSGVDGVGSQAMHYAASIGDIDMIRTMQEHGALVTATYLPQMSLDSIEVGIWEGFVRRACVYRSHDAEEDVNELISGLQWLEKLGCGPFSVPSADGRIYSSTIPGNSGNHLAIDEAICTINDPQLSESFLNRLKNTSSLSVPVLLSQALLTGMSKNCFSFARASINAGARADDVLDGETVESIARKNYAKLYSRVKNTAIDDSVAFSNALKARDAIESLDDIIAAARLTSSHGGMKASSHATA